VKTERQTSAGGVVVRRGPDGPEVLLASRRTRRGELVWGLPKGLVEPGEDPEQTALREVEEETGYRAKVREPLGDVSYWFVWQGTRIGERDREMEEVRWFPLGRAVDVAGFSSEKDILRKAAEAVVR
jgi:8-oxo-dGTP pyrophosphatase MutT (NUDIX family)